MTEEYTLQLIARRMQDLGFGKNYITETQHLVLQANELLEIEAYNQFYFLVKQVDNVRVRSDFGFFDLSFAFTNKQDYEHQGFIAIQNFSNTINHVLFIQVIPIHISNDEHEH
jgi:hypothetical protein